MGQVQGEAARLAGEPSGEREEASSEGLGGQHRLAQADARCPAGQQLSPAEVHGQLDRVVEQLREAFPQVAELLADAAPDILAFTAFPVAHWQKLWSNNPQERLNREIRRRTDVVGIFPNRLSARRLVGAVLAEQHDEWAEARRYLTIPNAAGNEALPTPNMLDAAA